MNAPALQGLQIGKGGDVPPGRRWLFGALPLPAGHGTGKSREPADSKVCPTWEKDGARTRTRNAPKPALARICARLFLWGIKITRFRRNHRSCFIRHNFHLIPAIGP